MTPSFLHVFGRAPSDLQLCFVQLKTLFVPPTCEYPATLKPGLGSLKVIENYTIQCGTHEFLLTFHSNYWPKSHRFRYKRRFPSKIAIFSHPPLVLNAPDEGVSFGIWYRRKGPECFYDEAIRWSKHF